ncbi:hypothetical protein ACUTAF_08000 [Pseudomonas sp. SP16.1]|uniref:hypothetical protein n=1 Tax=Pseudomonas sp. SP16.1 TaxID=3458854 RepID=UPI0040461173
MTPSPRYRSHAEQRAALGCAAKLDPDKHPRRFAKQQAREKFTPPKRCNQPSDHERTQALVEQARGLAHLHINAAARALGIGRSVLTRLRNDYGLEFAQAPRATSADRVIALAPTCATFKQLAAAAGISYAHTLRLAKEYGIELGGANGQEPA